MKKQRKQKQLKSSVVTGVTAGFLLPNPAVNQQNFDLLTHFVEHPAATYFIEVQGHSMQEAGIFSGDIIIVDRAKEPKNGQVVVAVVDGTFTVKYLQIQGGKQYLVAGNSEYAPILLEEGMNIELWGVVTFVIHSVSS